VSKKRHTVAREIHLFLREYRGAGIPAMRPDELSTMKLAQNVMIDAGFAEILAGRRIPAAAERRIQAWYIQ
jgi:hypothetical protein